MFTGFTVFALQNSGWCASADYAPDSYTKLGSATNCNADGTGGPFGNNVYQIVGGLLKIESIYDQPV